MPARARLNSSSRRVLATLAAALAVGAGGGAGAALLLDGSTTTVAHVAQATATTESAALASTNELTVNQIYRRARSGVVDIIVSQGPSKAEGSGFVIDKRGDIVTNEHVVSGGGSIQVRFAHGRKASAKVVGTDASSDVAVIKVSAPSSELQPLAFGDSSKVQMGDGVVAIGSPFGLAGTVTTGIVSALDRSITAPTTTRSPARSRPTLRSTTATPVDRCWTRAAT